MAMKDYGVITDLQLEMNEDTFELSGSLSRGEPFYQVLTKRAGQYLWYSLTRTLFSGEAPPMTSAAGTAPLYLPDDPNLTTHVEVKAISDDLFEVRGVTRVASWRIQVSGAELQWLWATLDVTLYPVGWEGRESGGAAYA